MLPSCQTCNKTEGAETKHSRCSRCRAVFYCSPTCQRNDWKHHKPTCTKTLQTAGPEAPVMAVPMKVYGQTDAPGGRNRVQMMQDLTPWAQSHNGDTFTVAVWQALDLLNRIERRLTHVLALTVRRTQSTEPRKFYSLIDAEAVPIELITERFGDTPEKTIKRTDVQQRAAGNLGAVMVMTFELLPGDNRPLREVISPMTCFTLQPLNLFDETRRSLFRLTMAMASAPGLPEQAWKLCVKNALDGGAYHFKFVEWSPR
ncbi:hypothetical protein FA95DRAFT_1565725 [Auriscalpium vulgare]|uniref:Uncharacterized protein n=1 Tax=Auriscalpium vulgare TaxID=40419 RepID=A0ACB8RBC7_9AGAM|nr:hypothetical protein FA95DRAFT_1565725 [Auriscalpium vulgare]